MRSCDVVIRDTTDSLYSCALDRGRRAMFWAGLTGRSRCLRALEELRQGGSVSPVEESQLQAETRNVPMEMIVGSEGRCADFDRDFNPLHEHNRERWLRIAAARRRGTPLPPVDLVQVGDLYFVQDGHHRISVARALGQSDIESRVSVWRVSGPLPWDERAGRARSSAQKTLVDRLYDGLLTYARALQAERRDWAARTGF